MWGVWNQNSGIFLSTDNGNNWKEVNNGFPKTTSVISLASNSQNHIFAGTMNGILRTTNLGQSWEPINNGINSKYIYSILIKLIVIDDDPPLEVIVDLKACLRLH
jgi:photosystem II stability/assembly factor-like uncharacterized protein